jgi:glycosyltransferase involved in cell wall biosynthesis
MLVQSDAVFSIGREEQWLLAWCGLRNVGYLPYYPPAAVVDRLREVRQRRELTPPGNRCLVLGSASNPSTRWGVVALLEWLRPMAHELKVGFDIVGVGTDGMETAFPSPAVKFHGWVETAQLDTMLAGAKALVVHQVAGVGALTRIKEALIAGVPVLGNPIGCRSATESDGVQVYNTPTELFDLLNCPLAAPSVPEPPFSAISRFAQVLSDCVEGTMHIAR